MCFLLNMDIASNLQNYGKQKNEIKLYCGLNNNFSLEALVSTKIICSAITRTVRNQFKPGWKWLDYSVKRAPCSEKYVYQLDNQFLFREIIFNFGQCFIL